MRRRAESVHCGAVVWIFLTRGKVAIVDASDADLAAFPWFCEQRSETLFYARRDLQKDGKRERVYLHVVVAKRKGIATDIIVDHENGDGLDCTRTNLRRATHRQNARNTKTRADNTSGYKGVSWHKGCGKWAARLKARGVYRSLGLFDTKEAAAEAYRAEAARVFGEFARP